MRNKFLLYVGCAVVTLFGIGLGLVLLRRGSDDPFGLVLRPAGLPRGSGYTSTNLMVPVTAVAFIVALIAVVVVLVRDRLRQVDRSRPVTPVDESRYLLHTHIERLRNIAESRGRHWKRSK